MYRLRFNKDMGIYFVNRGFNNILGCSKNKKLCESEA